MPATDKQIRYAMYLLDRAGYDTRYMSSQYRALGATMAERSGSVENWLRGRNLAEMSKLIDGLKARTK